MPVAKKRRDGRPAGGPKRPFSAKGTQRPKGSQNLKKPVVFNSLKTQIRDLKRLLEHGDDRMPADIRIIRERELAACEHELAQKQAESQAAARRKRMISKYHQVRFFDRQKATRALKKIRRELNTAKEPAQKDELLAKLHAAEVDVNYALYYPLSRPYSALFPTTKQEDSKLKNLYPESDGEDKGKERLQNPETSRTTRGDPYMWSIVEKAMEEGTLDALRNSDEPVATSMASRPLPRSHTADKGQRQKQKRDPKRKQKSGQPGILKDMLDHTKASVDEGGESDGGFFE
ncbi:hypothetical protein AOQ84DRAFT_285170 [Glonium stellatum]|uniref:rRNA-processing protein EFG1 n=1 Tax=Glonium stellatum TaxID=574774 RepID=A0A8E2JWP8_9PEZI|nr:hypothetical protein AOQ84DRAFT_285170 [Glonium stellatum]